MNEKTIQAETVAAPLAMSSLRAAANRAFAGALHCGRKLQGLGRAGWEAWTAPPVFTVAVSMRPVFGPWGGSSVFVHQLAACLRRRGCRVQYHLRGDVDVIVLIDPREDLESKAFGPAEIRDYKQRHPRVQVLHRINECDQRKQTTFMDPLLKEANQLADHTVFISEWLQGYFMERWFDPARPHSVIYNGADPAIFHPVGQLPYVDGQPFRICTHHWSDNPMKGFPVYEQVDRMIADGALPGVELWIIGRWPAAIRWRAARTFPAVSGRRLAGLLRQCHAHITASLWEPCGMHHVEAAQCGLPMAYHEDGGGIVEAGRRYGAGFRDDPAVAIHALRTDYAEYRRRVLAAAPDGERMAMAYADRIRDLALVARKST